MKIKKAMYWCDQAYSYPHETAQEEFAEYKSELEANGIILEEIEYPEYAQDCIDGQYFDVLFFDWGGMSFGNSMLETFCEYILEHAKDHPSRDYVMVSRFTAEAMEEAKREFEQDQANVFLSVRDFISHCKLIDEAAYDAHKKSI